MTGAIIGDIIGSYYAEHPTSAKRIELIQEDARFTQNALFATALCELLCYTDVPAVGWVERKIRAREIAAQYKKYALRYPELLGRSEKNWASKAGMSKSTNISAASAVAALPCAYVYDSLDASVIQAELSCNFLYCTDTAKSCAKAAAAAVFMLRNGADLSEIAEKCGEISGIDFSADHDDILDNTAGDRSPQAIIKAAFAAFFKSHDFESALRYGCACGKDSHITAAVSGAMAQAYYKEIPKYLNDFALSKLDSVMKKPIETFCKKYGD